jgi:hypothetical protein
MNNEQPVAPPPTDQQGTLPDDRVYGWICVERRSFTGWVKPFFPSPHATASSNRVVAPLGPSKARGDADKVLGEANKVRADAAEGAEFERLMVEMTETSPRMQSGIQLYTSDLTS